MNKLLFIITICFITACNVTRITSDKNIAYIAKDNILSLPVQQLNIFAPKNPSKLPVVIFAYGGSWESGRKELYSFLGKRLARKGYVAVIIDYPLAPQYKIHKMALSVAQAVNWTNKNIEKYGGDKQQIYVAGHSAGGHLITLNTLKDTYFDSLHVKNPIKGAIMIDAAGINMYDYLKEKKLAAGTSYLKAFTNDPAVWKEYSPLYFLDKEDPKLLMFLGGKTYPGIESSSKELLNKADSLSINIDFHLQKKKKHVPMITQFFWPWSKVYKWIDEFIRLN